MFCTYFRKGHCYVRRVEGGRKAIGYLCHPSQIKIILKTENPCILSMCPELEECLENPEAVLDFMVHDKRDSSAGGWRSLSAGETAALTMGSFEEEKVTRETVHWCLTNHPAVRGGFLYSCSDQIPPGLFKLLVEMYDIFRFPDQASMFSWMRLSHFSDFNPDDSSLASAMLLAIWLINGAAQMLSGRETESFFLQYASRLCQRDRADAPVEKIAWKTTRKLASFLRFTWIEGVKKGGTSFCPERFFGSKAEAEKFRAYIENLNKRLDNFPVRSRM